MMVIEEKMQEVLTGIEALKALVPASRIKVPGNHQNLARPYIVHMPISQEPITTHEGLQPLRVWEFYQVSVFADLYSTGTAIMTVLRENLPGVASDGVHIFMRGGGWYRGRDDDMNVEHFALDLKIAEAL